MTQATFIRNKIVTVEEHDETTLLARGLLADDIYGLEIKVWIQTPAMVISAVQGQWNRWTTPECHRAIEKLQEAVGACILDADFSPAIKKKVGRVSCRHFANLLIECCDGVREAAGLRVSTLPAADSQPEKARKPDPVEKPAPSKGPARETRPENGGCYIDLHVHTYPASPCSSVSVEDLVLEAKRIGLDGICLTDHHHRWSAGDLERLRQKLDFLIIGGIEVTTDQGDILVFGGQKHFPGVISIEELRKEAGEEAFLIAAHPFRGFLTFGVGRLGLTAERAMQRKLFQHVDAVEVLNGKVTDKENAFSAQVAEGLGMPVTGGSDAHELSEVGLYATRFEEEIRSEADLMAAMKGGRYRPVAFRDAH